MAFSLCMLGACSDKEHSTASLAPPMVVAASMPTTASAVSQAEPRELTELEKHEPDEIVKSESLVARMGKTLSLRLLSGKVLDIVNLDACNNYESCQLYIYRGLVADKQFFLVELRLYEGGSTFLISRKTGEQIDVIDDPHVSPDGKFIVTASESEAYRDAGVFLWEISDGVLISRLHFAPTDYQLYRFIRWDNSGKVNLLKTAWTPEGLCPEKTLVEYSVQLIAQNETWMLEGVLDEDKVNCKTN